MLPVEAGAGPLAQELSIPQTVWKNAPTRTTQTLKGITEIHPQGTQTNWGRGHRFTHFANILGKLTLCQALCWVWEYRMHLQGSTGTRHQWAYGDEGPFQQEMSRSLHMGLAGQSLRGCRRLFGQAEATPRMRTLALDPAPAGA